MRRLLWKGILLAGVLIWQLPCSAAAEEKFVAEINRYVDYMLRADESGGLWAAYYDPKGALHIKDVEKEKDFIVTVKGGSSGLAFDVQKGNPLVVWREKAAGKRFFFRASYDGGKTLSEPVIIDDGKSEPLARIKMGADTEGNVAAVWYGETTINRNKNHLYAVCSADFGRTFSKPRNLTLGYRGSIYPTVLLKDRKMYVFSYSTSPRESSVERYMLFRKSTDGCETWSDPLEIKKIGVVTLFVEPLKIGNRLHVFWFNAYDGVPVVENAYSDDDGATWKTTFLESTRGFDTGVMRVASDSKGHIYISLHGKKEPEGKSTVYLVRSEDNGVTWSDMIPLRHYSSKHTAAKNLIIRAEDDGTVVAVWQDSRNIRENIYMQYSKDYGKTWQENDIPLEDPGRFNTRVFPYTANIVMAKNRYYLPVFRFKSDNLHADSADLLLLDFAVEKGDKEK